MPTIYARAPMRLDLGGGWTDVPPFSTDVGGAVLSAAIARYARVTLSPRADGRVRLASDDYHTVVEGDPTEALAYSGELDLLKAAVRAAGAPALDLTVSSDAPPGAGLGASASVGVALLGALNALRPQWPRASLADRAHHLELDMGVAGGRQDQYAALHGGFQFLTFHDPAATATRIDLSPTTLAGLRRDLVLVYTGRSRVSGSIIATVMGAYRRGESRTTHALHRLKAIAVEMRDALLAGDLAAFGTLLGENWACQKALDPSTTTPQIDALFDLARRRGATGGKALGAGGGGCVLIYAPDHSAALRAMLVNEGLTIFDFDFDSEGLRVQTGELDADERGQARTRPGQTE